MDALPQLYDPSSAMMNVDAGARRGNRDLAGIDQDVARAIATSSVFGPREDTTPGRADHDPVTARVCVMCLLHIIAIVAYHLIRLFSIKS